MKFKTGQDIQQSGIYKVTHKEHRLPHEVTLVRDKIFPPCSECKTQVEFELLRAVDRQWGQIILYEIPALSDKDDLEEETAS